MGVLVKERFSDETQPLFNVVLLAARKKIDSVVEMLKKTEQGDEDHKKWEAAELTGDALPLLALMFDMKIAAQMLTSTLIPGSNPPRCASPTFE